MKNHTADVSHGISPGTYTVAIFWCCYLREVGVIKHKAAYIANHCKNKTGYSPANVSAFKPKQANAFNLKNDLGVTSYLVGKARLADIVKETPIENLQVILTGPRTPNASELIVDPMLEEMIRELKTMYDYIILDTPPVGLLSDALALMKFSDLNVYVLKAGFSKKDFVDIAHQIVEKNDVKHMVFLLNNVNIKNIPAGYGGGYYK